MRIFGICEVSPLSMTLRSSTSCGSSFPRVFRPHLSGSFPCTVCCLLDSLFSPPVSDNEYAFDRCLELAQLSPHHLKLVETLFERRAPSFRGSTSPKMKFFSQLRVCPVNKRKRNLRSFAALDDASLQYQLWISQFNEELKKQTRPV